LKRKLILLNLVLAALTAVAGWQWRVRWLAAKAHENAVLGRKTPAAPAPPHSPLANVAPTVAAQYIDIANKVLFNKERNPNLPLPEPPAPPPPEPMPALPVIRGVLNIDGPSAIMSEQAGGSGKEVHPGDTIGPFKLLAVNNEEIVLEWKGQEVRRRVAELKDRSASEPVAAALPVGQPAAPPPPKPVIVKAGPGQDMGAGRKACNPGDNTPDGTVMDGMKKVSWDTPFGKGCAWEAAK
jgi:hypothetical protein